jgi:hypothetical protein
LEAKNGPSCYVDPNSPPSSYAVAAVYEGDPSGWPKVVTATALRTGFVLPGLALAGIRGRQLLLGSLLGSVGITAALFILYGVKRSGYMNWSSQ